jgi:hypothetical protein
MDALEYAEKIAGETLNQARNAYDSMYDRVYKFATLVAGGADGVGAYALGKIGTAGAHLQVWPLGALSCWWFLIAGAVLFHAAASNTLMVGTASAAIRRRLDKHLKAAGSDGTVETALWFTRWDQLAAIDGQIESYSGAASRRAIALDRAYWCLACSPFIPALAYAVAAHVK